VLVVTPVPPLSTGRIPVTPVVKGRPVRLVATPEVGVPSKGVTSVGEVLRTVLPDPVLVVTPVPPEVTGSAVARTSEESEVIASMTPVVPSHITTIDLPLGIVTPTPAAALTVIAKPPVVEFLTKYSLLVLGTMRFRAALIAPVTLIKARLASFAVAPFPLVSV
jgi:hypothetical protein